MKTNPILLFILRSLFLTPALFIANIGQSQVQYSGTVNTGNVASAINSDTKATGTYSFAAGNQSVATGHTSVAIGTSDSAVGQHSFTIGDYCFSADQAFSIGQGARALSSQSYAFGKYVETYASGAITIGTSISGFSLRNTIPNSLMVGFNSIVPTLFVGESEATPGFSGHGRVGIGTSAPVARLQVSDGDIFIEDISRGIIMKSPDGNCWRGTLNNSGQLEFVKLPDCISLSDHSLPQGDHENDIRIFPNPATKYLDIVLSGYALKHYNRLSLYNAKGASVFSMPIKSTTCRISLSDFNQGTYIISFSGDEESYSQKVLVK